MSASASGSASIAQLLLILGVETQVQNRQGQTAIHLARNQGHGKIVEMILNVSEYKECVKGIDLDEWLRWATVNGHDGCVREILAAGANVTRTTKVI